MSQKLAKRIQRLKDEIPVRFPNAKLTPVSEDRLRVIMESYPGLPEEYISFLREIGEGFWYPGEGAVLAPASEFAEEFDLFGVPNGFDQYLMAIWWGYGDCGYCRVGNDWQLITDSGNLSQAGFLKVLEEELLGLQPDET